MEESSMPFLCLAIWWNEKTKKSAQRRELRLQEVKKTLNPQLVTVEELSRDGKIKEIAPFFQTTWDQMDNWKRFFLQAFCPISF